MDNLPPPTFPAKVYPPAPRPQTNKPSEVDPGEEFDAYSKRFDHMSNEASSPKYKAEYMALMRRMENPQEAVEKFEALLEKLLKLETINQKSITIEELKSFIASDPNTVANGGRRSRRGKRFRGNRRHSKRFRASRQ
jgi:hypothetical protein